MNPLPQISLKKGKEKSLERKHPWIFSGALQSVPEEVKEGDLVKLLFADGQFAAVGMYQEGSIAVRILSFEDEAIDRNFWEKRWERAFVMRENLGFFRSEATNCFRLCHGEGDGFPGLIADYYAGTVVLQAHTVGMYNLLPLFAEILTEEYEDDIHDVYNKSAHTVPFKADIEPEDGFLVGDGDELLVNEYSSKFKVNIREGQKTGFFLDQRENRKLLGEYAAGKKVLNTFCYSGGFSVAALRGGAQEVVSVDSSAPAMQLTDENMAINFGPNVAHTSVCADVFQYLGEMEEDFDIVVLDPPAFAKHQKVLRNGLKGYMTINQKALQKIKSGGLLFTFSCSQAVSMQDFRTTLFTAALRAGRNVRILHQLHQPADHPISIFHPEGEYLKGLVLEVE